MQSQYRAALLLLCATVPCPVLARTVAPEGTSTPVAVVELFTSEGCSSCPPADTLLRTIDGKQAATGQLIVGLSEHVTYWNQLGWRDPFSEQAFTDRQEAYASRFTREGPYTPQMVLNGQDQFVGSNRTALEQALQADAHRPHAALKILALSRQAQAAEVTFSLTGATSAPLDMMLAITDDADQSDVARGENAGRLLRHAAVARSLVRLTSVSGNTQQTLHVQLPESIRRAPQVGHHLVVFAQEPHLGRIVGAAAVPLSGS